MLESNLWRKSTSDPDMPLFRVLESLVVVLLMELVVSLIICCIGLGLTVLIVFSVLALIGSIIPPPLDTVLVVGTGVANSAKSEKWVV